MHKHRDGVPSNTLVGYYQGAYQGTAVSIEMVPPSNTLVGCLLQNMRVHWVLPLLQ